MNSNCSMRLREPYTACNTSIMEIGNRSIKMNWKYRILFALGTAILHTSLLWIFNYHADGKLYTINSLIIQGVFFGVFFGIGFPYLIEKVGGKLGEKLKVIPEVEVNEHIEIKGPANLFRGIEAVGGMLFLTNRKLIFKSHKINIQKGQTDLDYADMKEVTKRKTAKLIDNGIRILTQDGTAHDFVVNDRNVWFEKLSERIR